MPWTAPVDPVSGSVITVSYAVANMLDPIRWLRLLTGNADPPGSAYVAVSDTASAVSWKKVPSDALAPGVAVANLGYTPVNKAGDTGIGALGAASLTATGNIVSTTGSISAAGNVSATSNITTTTGTIQGAAVNATTLLSAPAASISGTITAATGTISGTWTVANLAATTIGATSNIVSSGGSIAANGNVSANGNITTTTGTVAGSVVQASSSMNVAGQTVWNAAHFAQPTATPGANRVPMSDGAGKLDAWITSGGGGGTTTPIPPGLIAFCANAGSIPSGWTRVTAANGRFIAVAGSSGVANGPTFPDGGAAGTNDWAHAHNVPGQSFSVNVTGSATGGPSDQTGTSSNVNGLAAAGGVNLNTTGHTHSLSGVSFAVSASGGGTGTALNSAAVAWVPPAWALVCIQKS